MNDEKTMDPVEVLTLQGTSVNPGISVVIERYPHFSYRIQNYIYICTQKIGQRGIKQNVLVISKLQKFCSILLPVILRTY